MAGVEDSGAANDSNSEGLKHARIGIYKHDEE